MKVMPVLPANIKSMTRILPTEERLDVIPLESPTVPNAEAASKKSSLSVNVPALSDEDSDTSKSAYIAQRRQIPFTNTESAFCVDSSAMSLRKTDGLFLSEARLYATQTRRKSVVVLRPPVIEPGLPPVSINIIEVNVESGEKSD